MVLPAWIRVGGGLGRHGAGHLHRDPGRADGGGSRRRASRHPDDTGRAPGGLHCERSVGFCRGPRDRRELAAGPPLLQVDAHPTDRVALRPGQLTGEPRVAAVGHDGLRGKDRQAGHASDRRRHPCRPIADRLQLSVQRIAGAFGGAAVAVPADALEGDRRATGVAIRPAPAARHRHRARDRGAVHGELPSDQASERVDRLGGLRDGREGAEVRDPGREPVVTLGLSPDHRLIDAARPTFEDLPEPVDQEVVADVVPAVGVPVVLADRQHDSGGVLGGVVVGRHRVVHERHVDASVTGTGTRRAAPGLPDVAADDRGRPGGLAGPGGGGGRPRGARRPGRLRHGHERSTHAAERPARTELELVGPSHPDGFAGGERTSVVGSVTRHLQGRPAAPRTAASARPDLEPGSAHPGAADTKQVEPTRCPQDAGGPAPGERRSRHVHREALRALAGGRDGRPDAST